MPTLPDGERAQAWLRIARLYGDKLNAAEYALTSLDEALKLDADAGRRGRAAHLALQAARALERAGDGAGRRGALRRAGRGAASRTSATRRRRRRRIAPRWRRIRCSTKRARRSRRCCARRRMARAGRRARRARAVRQRRGGARAQGGGGGAVRRSARRSQAGHRALRGAGRRRPARPRRCCARSSGSTRPTGRRRSTSRCLGRQAEAVESDRERAALYRRMASLWEEIPGSTARAEECLEKLLAVDPRSEDALRSLERLYYAERKWNELIDACRRHAALVPPPNAGEIYFQIGGHLRARAARSTTRRSRPTSTSRRAAESRRHDGGADPRLREDRRVAEGGRRARAARAAGRGQVAAARAATIAPARSTPRSWATPSRPRRASCARSRSIRRTCRR